MNEARLIVGVPHVPAYGATDADLARARTDFGVGSGMFGMVRAALVASAWATVEGHSYGDRLRVVLAFAQENPELGGLLLGELRAWAGRIFVEEWLAPVLEEKAPWLFEEELHVCPGCFAIGEDPCAEYCPDAALAEERLRELDEGDFDFSDDDEEAA